MVLPAYPPKGHSAPLLFDSLEPRLLLNADVLAVDLVTANPAGESQHLLVRMIEESTRTATQAETVQRVQIVDRQAAGDTGGPCRARSGQDHGDSDLHRRWR